MGGVEGALNQGGVGGGVRVRRTDSKQTDWPKQREGVGGTESKAEKHWGQLTEGPKISTEGDGLHFMLQSGGGCQRVLSRDSSKLKPSFQTLALVWISRGEWMRREEFGDYCDAPYCDDNGEMGNEKRQGKKC